MATSSDASSFGEVHSAHVSFEEFSPITNVRWREQVLSDLKGKQTADGLIWQPFGLYPDVKLEATYLHDQPEPALAQAVRAALSRKEAGWRYREMLCVDAGQEEAVVEQASQCLLWGAHEISIWGLETPDYLKLLTRLGQADVKEVRFYLEAPYGIIERIADHPYFTNMGGKLIWIPAMTPTYVGETGYLKSLATLLADFPHVHVLADVSGYAEAGASLITQSAIACSILTEWLHRLSDNSFDVRSLYNRVELHVGVGPQVLLEIAGLRALRFSLQRIWQGFGVQNPDVKIWARASQAWSTPQDPDTNLIRATCQAVAMAIGGADVISIPQHNAGLVSRSPQQVEEAMRWARNIQHLLKEEGYLNLVADAAGGSRYLEHATAQIAESIWKAFQHFEAQGGYLSNYKNQRFQQRTLEEATLQKTAIQTGQQVIVGGNKFRPAQVPALQTFGQPLPGLPPANFGFLEQS